MQPGVMPAGRQHQDHGRRQDGTELQRGGIGLFVDEAEHHEVRRQLAQGVPERRAVLHHGDQLERQARLEDLRYQAGEQG